jgi:hypothetical protein
VAQYASLKCPDTEINIVLSEFVSEVELITPSESDDLAAIRTAIDFEDNGMEYYASLRDSINDKKERELFGLLSSIKREHYLSLKDAEEHYIDPAGWYRSHEHLSLD